MTTDYEQVFGGVDALELTAYQDGFLGAGRHLLGWTVPLGAPRRLGIVDTPADLFDRFVVELEESLAHNDGLDRLERTLADSVAELRAKLAEPRVAGISAPLARLMSFHTVNWILTEDFYRRRLRLLGCGDRLGMALFLTLLADEASHLMTTGSTGPHDSPANRRRELATDAALEAEVILRFEAGPHAGAVLRLARAGRLAVRAEEERKVLQRASVGRLVRARDRDERPRADGAVQHQ